MEGFINYIAMIEWEPFVLILALIIIDYVLGIMGAVITKTFSSSKMRLGLWHKCTYIIVMFVAIIIERLAFYYDIGLVSATGFFCLVCGWIIITELGSILENLVVINPKFADNAFMSIFAKREEIDALEEGKLDEIPIKPIEQERE